MEEGYDFEKVTCIDEREKAIRVTGGDLGEKKMWVAQSQITSDSEVWHLGQTGTLSITEWLAKQKGLL